MDTDTLIIVTARNEADRIERTLRALARAFPDAPVFVADDGSIDGTGQIAERWGATVVPSPRSLGKGAAATLAARAALASPAASAQTARAQAAPPAAHTRPALAPESASEGAPAGVGAAEAHVVPVVVLCDGDLGDSAALLGPLAGAVRDGSADLAIAVFARSVGGGVGLTLGCARWAIRARCGLAPRAPISGQRALRTDALARLLPFAHGFGMEVGMTIDAARAGLRVVELQLDLSHRATGRTPAGFVHRGRQLLDVVRAYHARR